MTAVVEVQSLCKSYGNLRAVEDVTFEVQQGEIFGMVGPNGAGKTTTIECIEGLRRRDAGTVRVLGLDPRSDRVALAERVGIQLQQSNLPPRLGVGEAIDLFASFYSQHTDRRQILDRMGLGDKQRTPVAKLSGGQRQRLFIALALINQPELVFLDELTTGLDPQARRSMWDLVREIRDQGCTVFLTTHFMEEAERLCDRVLILDQGKIVALDAPEALVRSLGLEKRLVFTLADGRGNLNLGSLSEVRQVEVDGDRVTVYGARPFRQRVGKLETEAIPTIWHQT
jgi:ABC-2 type transport system ATP-binding protein